MATNEKIISTLNNLVEINNDRIEGYEKAEKETKDSDLKPLFHEMADHSRTFKNELSGEIKKLGGTPVEGTSASGKLFRIWMDFKSAVTGRNRNSIINACETGEDSAVNIYEDILSAGNTLTPELRNIVEKQKSELQKDHDKINVLKEKEGKEKVGSSSENGSKASATPAAQATTKQNGQGAKKTPEPVPVEGNGKSNNYSE